MAKCSNRVFVILDEEDCLYGVYSSKDIAESMLRAFDSSQYSSLRTEERTLDIVYPVPAADCEFYYVERDGHHPYRTHTSNVLGCNVDASRVGTIKKVGMRALIYQAHGRDIETFPGLSTIISAKSPVEARRVAVELFDQYEQEHPDWRGAHG
jgi:hypothetical protein